MRWRKPGLSSLKNYLVDWVGCIGWGAGRKEWIIDFDTKYRFFNKGKETNFSILG